MTETVTSAADEFYIGYEGHMPCGMARRVLSVVGLFACGSAAVVALWLGTQHRLAASRFEFGTVTQVTGVLGHAPYPSVASGGRLVWLVGPGKFGADRMLTGTPDGPIVVAGSAIQRGNVRMLEVAGVTADAERRFGVPPRNAGSASPPRTVTLRGEIVDSKCFLGVMNPGEGAVHRDCARRCVSGGIPPMLVVRDGRHREELILLLAADGGAIGRETVQATGKPVEVSGFLVRGSDGYTLRVSSWK